MIHREYCLIKPGGEEYPLLLNVGDVNLYNWTDKLESMIDFIDGMETFVTAMYGPFTDRVGLDELIEGGEDSEVSNPEAVITVAEQMIEKYAPVEEHTALKAEFKELVDRVGTASNRKLANQTFAFCARLVPIR